MYPFRLLKHLEENDIIMALKLNGVNKPRTALAATASLAIACLAVSAPFPTTANMTLNGENVRYVAAEGGDAELAAVTDDLSHSGINIVESESMLEPADASAVKSGIGIDDKVLESEDAEVKASPEEGDSETSGKADEEVPGEVYDYWTEEQSPDGQGEPDDAGNTPQEDSGNASDDGQEQAAESVAELAADGAEPDEQVPAGEENTSTDEEENTSTDEEASKDKENDSEEESSDNAGEADDGAVYAILMPSSYSPDVNPVLVSSKDSYKDYQVIDIDLDEKDIEGDTDKDKLLSVAKTVAQEAGVPVKYTLFIDDYDLTNIKETMDHLANPHIVLASEPETTDKELTEADKEKLEAEDAKKAKEEKKAKAEKTEKSKEKTTEQAKFTPVPDDEMWYDQNAYPGYDYQYGYDIPGYGCGLCATTVAVNQATGQHLDAPDVAAAMQNWSDANGGWQYCTWAGTDWGPWKTVVEGAFGLKVEKIEDREAARQALEKGAVIVSGNDYTFRSSMGDWYYTDSHVICFYRTENGSFFAKDSAGSLGGPCIEYTPEDLDQFWPGASNRSYAVYAA